MNLGGLSPEKAPPVEAPLGLFYLMPVFLALVGLVFAWQGEQVMVSRWTPAALAATHFVVLGVLAPVMCGAMLQLSPVLLGAPYPRVRLVARLTAAGLGSGGLMIGTGFLFSRPGLLLAGGAAAVAGLAVFLIGSSVAVGGISGGPRRATLWTVRLAVLALGVTIALGLTLAAARLGWVELPQQAHWTDTHVAWGLAGWVGLLLTGIGMELIPLFYVSPPFAEWLKGGLPLTVFGLLLLVTALGWRGGVAGSVLRGGVITLFGAHLVYNALALYMEQRRQRPRRDANLWLWQLGHLSVFGAFFIWLGGGGQHLVGILLLGGAVSFVIGSLMKVVPFLSWLDLQQRRIAARCLHVGLPRLRTLWPESAANAIGLTLVAALASILAGSLWPVSAHLGGALLVVCAALLAHVLLRAARLRHGVIRLIAQPPSGTAGRADARMTH